MWSVYRQDFTKEEFIKLLKTKECRESIHRLELPKVRSLLVEANLVPYSTLSQSNFVNKFIEAAENSNVFERIFKITK